MLAQFVLSAFGDEIAADLDEQIDALLADGIRHVEFRAAWGKNVLALDDEEVERGFVLTCQTHPVGDAVTVDFDA